MPHLSLTCPIRFFVLPNHATFSPFISCQCWFDPTAFSTQITGNPQRLWEHTAAVMLGYGPHRSVFLSHRSKCLHFLASRPFNFRKFSRDRLRMGDMLKDLVETSGRVSFSPLAAANRCTSRCGCRWITWQSTPIREVETLIEPTTRLAERRPDRGQCRE